MLWTDFADQNLSSLSRSVPGDATPALSAEHAITACRGFRERDVCVLGGDIYRWNGARFRPSQGWSVDRQPGEAWLTFRDRSIGVALATIEREAAVAGQGEAFFTLVCSTEVETVKHMYGRGP